MKKLRIGILSAAGIARKNWPAMVNSGNCVVTAVASRSRDRSERFISECQGKCAFERPPAELGSYDELIDSAGVDAVYIPLPTGLRREWVLRAAAAGKHVICEKPCGINAAEVAEMTDACKKNGVQFMDGVMFMHSPRLARIRELLDDGDSIGPVRRISTAFSFYVGEDFFRGNIRVDGRLEPTGCLGDLGWYCIRFALWTMNWQMPQAVSGRILTDSGTIAGRTADPIEFSGELIFEGGVSCGFYCSFLAPHQQWVSVSGKKGWLRIPDFVHPYDAYEPAFELNRSMIRVAGEPGEKMPPDGDRAFSTHPTGQIARMFRNFANQIFSGKLNEDWPMWALKTQQVMDGCFAMAGHGRMSKS